MAIFDNLIRLLLGLLDRSKPCLLLELETLEAHGWLSSVQLDLISTYEPSSVHPTSA